MARALVTGGAGFIGSHLTDHLVKDGYQVRILDDLSSGSLTNVKRHLKEGNLEFIKGDIRDRTVVQRSVADVDVVVHLAAQISVTVSVEDPVFTFDVNQNGTINLLRASAEAGVRRFVFASSCAVYGDPKTLPVTEETQPNPISPYAESKLTGERACLDFQTKGLLDTSVLRFFNIYGPRQRLNDYSGVITRFIDSAKRQLPLIVYGDGLQTRDFVNVADVVEAIVAAVTRQSAVGATVNLGTGHAVSVNELAQTIIDLTGAESGIIHEPERVGDIRNSYADISKAKQLLAYEPRVSLKSGLKALIDA